LLSRWIATVVGATNGQVLWASKSGAKEWGKMWECRGINVVRIIKKNTSLSKKDGYIAANCWLESCQNLKHYWVVDDGWRPGSSYNLILK